MIAQDTESLLFIAHLAIETNKIASFDLDSTLIKTKSGRK